MTTVDQQEEPDAAGEATETTLEESEQKSPNNSETTTQLLAAQHEDDESVLETLDSCVGCVEGIGQQHDFEDGLDNLELIDRGLLPSYQTLSEAEANLIRAQIIEKQSETIATEQAASLATLGTLPNIDLLNICGADEDIDDARATSALTFGAQQAAATARTANESAQVGSGNADDTNGQDACTALQGTTESTTHVLQCAICFDEAAASSQRITFAKLPCCGHAEDTTTVKICTACILILTSQTSDGASRIGRCPRCRSWIVVKTPVSTQEDFTLEIKAVATAGQCLVCNQVKEHLVEDQSVCDACFLGRRHPVFYECQQCHVTQRIPHPMYRYQDKPDTFGSVTWACQGRCGTFTKWRIRADQLPLVPVGDAPEAWGQDYMTAARTRVEQARRELSGNSADGATGCTIL